MVEIHEEQANLSETMIISMLTYVIMTCIHSNSLCRLDLLLILRADLRQYQQISSFGKTQVSGNNDFTTHNRRK